MSNNFLHPQYFSDFQAPREGRADCWVRERLECRVTESVRSVNHFLFDKTVTWKIVQAFLIDTRALTFSRAHLLDERKSRVRCREAGHTCK